MNLGASYARSLLGTRLCGKWQLIRVIGSGGMSTVFEAMHRNGRRVAIKVLRPELALRQRLRGRFKREAYAANRVDHADVVQIIDEDTTDDGLTFIVMEYLEGETLGARLRRQGRPLDPVDVVSAAIRVLDILSVAHRSGVIHRDIKPDNIFTTRKDGRIKLLDFGVASLREISAGCPDLTEAGVPLGTPAFMAPEQARGHGDRVDARTDIWGLGATMFTLLTGRFVHADGNACEILIAAGTKPAPSLASVAFNPGSELVAVVDRALAFEKDARWPDAVSMREALVAVLAAGEADLGGGSSLSAPFTAEDTVPESSADGEASPRLGTSRPFWPNPASRRMSSRARTIAALASLVVVAGLLWSRASSSSHPRDTAVTAAVAPDTAALESRAEAILPKPMPPSVARLPETPARTEGALGARRVESRRSTPAPPPIPPTRPVEADRAAPAMIDPLDRR